MPDSHSETGKRDDTRISIHQEHEVTYWTRVFKCTPAVLREAVATVGPMVADVRVWVKKYKSKIA